MKWTKEKCKEIALKYKHRSDFQNGNLPAYSSAYKNKWLDDICQHMTRKINSKWTLKTCQIEALKYDYKKDFRRNHGGAYNFSLRNNILDEVCSHMIKERKEKGYWTKERCQKDALKYEHRSEFSEKSPGSYNASKRKDWLDEVCSHMKPIGNYYKRCIYSVEFDDKSVYIGLTYNFNIRKKQHLRSKKSTVYKYHNKTNIIPIFKQLTEYVDIEIAIKNEQMYLENYKTDNWMILNLSKTGSLGSSIEKWNREKCENEAIKYKTRTKFQRKCSGAYHYCRRNEILDEVCSHMVNVCVKWTYDICKKEALKYKYKKDFMSKSFSAYGAAKRNDWFDEITLHMKNSRIKWTKERCQEEASKYNKTDFIKKCRNTYNASRRNNWLESMKYKS